MQNFAFANGHTFSIGKKPLAVFNGKGLNRRNAGQQVLDKVKELMMPPKGDSSKVQTKILNELIMVTRGNF